MHTILKFLKCRWLISQNIALFHLAKTLKLLEIRTKQQMLK